MYHIYICIFTFVFEIIMERLNEEKTGAEVLTISSVTFDTMIYT